MKKTKKKKSIDNLKINSKDAKTIIDHCSLYSNDEWREIVDSFVVAKISFVLLTPLSCGEKIKEVKKILKDL